MQFLMRWKLITDWCDSLWPNSGVSAEVKGKCRSLKISEKVTCKGHIKQVTLLPCLPLGAANKGNSHKYWMERCFTHIEKRGSKISF